MRITVLTGGATAERAVAFASASQIVAALRGRKHEVQVVDLAGGLLDDRAEGELLGGAVGLTPPTVDALAERERHMLSEGLAELEPVRNAEVLFLAVHGGALEGGTLQAVLDVVGVPYTGSGPLASALAMDKDLSKRLFRATGVPVPAWFMTPVGPEDVSTGLGGFALAYRATLLRGSADQAAAQVPLDATVSPSAAFATPLELAPLSRWRALSGGTVLPISAPTGRRRASNRHATAKSAANPRTNVQ